MVATIPSFVKQSLACRLQDSYISVTVSFNAKTDEGFEPLLKLHNMAGRVTDLAPNETFDVHEEFIQLNELIDEYLVEIRGVKLSNVTPVDEHPPSLDDLPGRVKFLLSMSIGDGLMTMDLRAVIISTQGEDYLKIDGRKLLFQHHLYD